MFLIVLLLIGSLSCDCFAAEKFTVIAYHDIVEDVIAEDDITPDDFIRQLNFFKLNGFHPVSVQDIEAAASGGEKLPDKPILLTFDDGYLSFYKIVYPALRLFNYPAVLAVVNSWADRRSRPDSFYGNKQFMTWEQIQEVAASGLVTVASHSDDMHHYVPANPQGNVEAAMTTFVYDARTKSYETEEEYTRRISSDMAGSVRVFEDNLGIKPFVYVWPYGAYNRIALQEAKKNGYRIFLTLDDGFADLRRLDRANRYYAQNSPLWIPLFKEDLKKGLVDLTPIRGVQIDLDKIVDPQSYERSDANLGRCLERLSGLGVNTVIVQAFCDRKGTGNVRSLYFRNSVLPVEMDFLSHAVNRIKSRGMQAYVWMPSLSFLLPDPKLTLELQVREWKDGRIRPATSSYRRLSPFDPRSLAISQRIFRDLSAYVDFDGVLFQDDAYLTDEEDFHPGAAAAFQKAFGMELTPSSIGTGDMKRKWMEFKTEALDRYISELVETIHAYRPTAKTARNIYSEPVTRPASQEWFSQNLESYLKRYDYTVIMAYSSMEKIGGRARTREWMRDMVDRVKELKGSDKVIFKLQAFDWRKNRWIRETTLKEEMAYLLSLGARHIAYYPDGAIEDKPEGKAIGDIISGREFLKKKGRAAGQNNPGKK
jgi:biofilm PGA synthesis lipoprotein PgaB